MQLFLLLTAFSKLLNWAAGISNGKGKVMRVCRYHRIRNAWELEPLPLATIVPKLLAYYARTIHW